MKAEEPSSISFFVYGTLRGGESNHFHIQHSIVQSRSAILRGSNLWNLGPYPMAIRGEGSVFGEIVDIAPTHYAKVLEALDCLEGVNRRFPETPGGLFHREKLEVECGKEIIEAWVYLGREDLALRGKKLAGGDWKKRAFQKQIAPE